VTTSACTFEAINGLLLDMLVAVARKDYEDPRRQKQGQAKARAAGKYAGRPENSKRTAKIAAVFRAGASHSAVGCGPATVAKITKHVQKAASKVA
jgi:DNA invertase Pin-like site-specific DNA recombinase